MTTTAAPNAMKIELRNLKVAAVAAEDARIFAATIYIDGSRAGMARNDGHGEPMSIAPRACAARLSAWAASRSKTASTLMNDLLEDALVERAVRRVLARKVLYTMAGRDGLFEAPSRAIMILKDPALTQQLMAEKVLNLLPIEEAVALCRARGQRPLFPPAITLTPQDRERAANCRLVFKHEDDVKGAAIGPAWWITGGELDNPHSGTAAGKFREGWVYLRDLKVVAKALRVQLDEV